LEHSPGLDDAQRLWDRDHDRDAADAQLDLGFGLARRLGVHLFRLSLNLHLKALMTLARLFRSRAPRVRGSSNVRNVAQRGVQQAAELAGLGDVTPKRCAARSAPSVSRHSS
jgi:hypothetical protein